MLFRSQVAQELRAAGFAVVSEHENRSLKAQFRTANRLDAAIVVIVAEQEVAEGNVSLKDMRSGDQEKVPRDQVVAWIKERLL